MAVIFGYFDDSNTHKQSKLVTLCGFLGDEDTWGAVDEKWQAVLDKPDWPNRPKEFHMVDCVHGYGEFLDWKLAERLALFGDMATIAETSDIMALGSTIAVEDLDVLSEDDKLLMKRGGLEEPLDYVFQYIVQTAITWTRKYYKTRGMTDPPEVALVFDIASEPIVKRYLSLYSHTAAKHRYGEILNSISFVDSKKFTPIQVADMLSYTTYHWTAKQRYPSEVNLDFPIIEGFKRLIANVANDGGMFTATSLRTMVGQELINIANREFRPY